MMTVTAKRRLLLDPDYRADPLWDYETGSMVDLDRLPIAESLRGRVRSWAADWERLAERQMHADDVEAGMLPGPADPPRGADWAANASEMERVWRLLLDDLGPGWAIAVAVADDDGGRRSVRWSPGGASEEVHEPAGRRFWTSGDDRQP